MWYVLRGRQFHGFKFRRQQPIGPFIADFVCFERKLIIELDGDQHGSKAGLAYDKTRSRRLRRHGFQVLRFANHELITNFDGVLERITLALAD